ncbi:MAG: sugar phosphate isomerase/epimerase [Oscillospiraceae bacterium]|nr:sugar phosphate isomerase/epimerase [Oscillospiraceae bacterium]
MTTGLVSVTFRGLGCDEIIALTKSVGLDGIEWGGDIHVPAGQVALAREVGGKTRAAGLKTLAYGSYYRTGTQNETGFGVVLETALALQAPIIRVWAYNKGSNETGPEEYETVVKDIRVICRTAKEQGVRVAMECHNNTLTDDFTSAQRLMDAVGSDNLFMYWQPNQLRDFDYNLRSIEALLPRVTNVHVFEWDGNGGHHPLERGRQRWEKYISVLESGGEKHSYLLEFMPDGRAESLKTEAGALSALCGR